jgi:hypothetical protein
MSEIRLPRNRENEYAAGKLIASVTMIVKTVIMKLFQSPL